MNANTLAGALRDGSVNASGAGSHSLVAQAGRFEALLQQPQGAAPSRLAGQTPQQPALVQSGDSYTDEVAPQKGEFRPVAIPAEAVKFGQNFSDEMRALQTRFDSSSKTITDPYLLEVREGIKAAVQFQDMNARLRATMKAVELSAQGFSQLFKMQG
jgi:hypothetical protein